MEVYIVLGHEATNGRTYISSVFNKWSEAYEYAFKSNEAAKELQDLNYFFWVEKHETH